jgi:PAS domain S-box-containing protein
MQFKKIVTTIWKQRHLVMLLITWSVLLCLSAIWNLHENFRGTYARALVEAETIFQHNLAYRRWNSMHGGLYARVSEINEPNPYILTDDRDIIGTDGTRLTIINPFQMTKQAYDLLRQQSPELAVLNRTVSLDPLNPDNEPDEWETAALEAFEEGMGALSEITTIDGAPYMRLISPYVTEQRCLGCHQEQGYEINDIRGGMSIAVPMFPYYRAAVSSRDIIVKTHLLLWLLGVFTIGLLFAGLRKYQNTIQEEEEKFRIVSEFAYNFEYWIDENRELSFISPSCKRITGYSRKEFLENKDLMYDIIHPEDKILFKDHLDVLDAPGHQSMEYRILTKGGAVRWLSHTCNPIFAEDQFLGRRGSNIDITGRKKLEEELLEAKKLEYLGHFAGGVAHDFNNVLTSISTLTHLMHDHIEQDDTVLNEYTDNIIIAAKLGQNLTSNLLLFGRKLSMDVKKLQLDGIVRNIEKILHVLVGENVICKVRISNAEQLIMADQYRIEQVLINLTTNARDAMAKGGTLSINTAPISLHQMQSSRFGDIPAGDYVLLSVSDTGSGIDEETLVHIFEPFYSTKDGSKGTGLGLSIVHDIVKQHGAFIDIDTSLGQGTTFNLFFPACKEDHGSTISTTSKVAAAEDARSPEEGTILLVDDDWLIRKSLSTYFSNRGYSVLVADNGDEAIKQYQQNRDSIALVILDVMLPKKSGNEVYDALRKENPEVAVLFISGSTIDELAEKNIYPGEVEFLPKPLDMDLFSSKVKEMLTAG